MSEHKRCRKCGGRGTIRQTLEHCAIQCLACPTMPVWRATEAMAWETWDADNDPQRSNLPSVRAEEDAAALLAIAKRLDPGPYESGDPDLHYLAHLASEHARLAAECMQAISIELQEKGR